MAESRWINDGHTVVLGFADDTATWGWVCPWRDNTAAYWRARPEDSWPPCRRDYDADGAPLPVPTAECVVAPWFEEEGVIGCLVTDGATITPDTNPIPAEYAWFGAYYRWRPAGWGEEEAPDEIVIRTWDGTVVRRIARGAAERAS